MAKIWGSGDEPIATGSRAFSAVVWVLVFVGGGGSGLECCRVVVLKLGVRRFVLGFGVELRSENGTKQFHIEHRPLAIKP